jgi:hypothetical protein
MDVLWEKYRDFATTSLDMAQDSSSLKDIAALLDIAQFWVQLTEGAVRKWVPNRVGLRADFRQDRDGFSNSSGSFAMLAAMRRASSDAPPTSRTRFGNETTVWDCVTFPPQLYAVFVWGRVD